MLLERGVFGTFCTDRRLGRKTKYRRVAKHTRHLFWKSKMPNDEDLVDAFASGGWVMPRVTVQQLQHLQRVVMVATTAILKDGVEMLCSEQDAGEELRKLAIIHEIVARRHEYHESLSGWIANLKQQGVTAVDGLTFSPLYYDITRRAVEARILDTQTGSPLSKKAHELGIPKDELEAAINSLRSVVRNMVFVHPESQERELEINVKPPTLPS